MQTIYLKKFGKVLVSRPAGMEAFNAIRPTLVAHEPIQIDFADVLTVTPSWFDEFLTNLAEFAMGTVTLLPTHNASVLAALPVLATAREDKVAEIIQRFLRRKNQS
ncbi:hypothetical protein HY629_01150 [Candidatus Uhrbacteria bacterium]|nr:hypothetical protein [Candidatus Uhrbacteria bacterium]